MKQQVVRIKEEAGRCLLCHEPKCNAACPHGIDVGRIVRALNFENPQAPACSSLLREL